MNTSVVNISFGVSGQTVVAAPSDISSRYTISNSSDSSTPDLSGSPLVLDVLALRRGEALQRFREISLCTPAYYRSQIKAHFGVDVGSELSGMSTYIGGEASSLDISEVVNTNITESNEALIAGKGVGTGQFSDKFYAKDWGILMCIYHSVPLLDYDLTGQDGQLLVASVEDLPIPEFDNIGMESVPAIELFNSTGFSAANVNRLLGYLPRYNIVTGKQIGRAHV